MLEYYRILLTEGVGDGNRHVLSGVVASCNNLYPTEVIDEIRSAYKQGLVDTGFIGLDSIERTLLSDKEDILRYYREYDHHQLINDTIDELKGVMTPVPVAVEKSIKNVVGKTKFSRNLCDMMSDEERDLFGR